jgi:two-component system OmpR family sensor kinase
LHTLSRATRTLRGRLILAAGGSILAAVAMFGVAAVLLVRHELSGSLDAALRSRAEEVAQLAVSAPAVLTQPGALESPVSGRQLAVEVIDARGRILARSLTLGARLLPEDRLVRAAIASGATGFETIHLGGRPFRLYAAPIAQAGGTAAGGAVGVASDTSDISHTIRRLELVLTVSGVAAALLAAFAAAALTRRGLLPLRRLARAVIEIERTADPARRLPEPRAADELAQLTGVLNRMLQSLEAARVRERRFLADASHELRTPVTALLGNVEYAARHGADADVLADLKRDAQRLARLVDQLLVLERAGVGGQEPVPVKLDELVREVADARERVQIDSVASTEVMADPDALKRALENLIENGLIHGPAGGVVTVALAVSDGRARLSVSDQGRGPDPGDRDRMFERFWRGPGSTERSGAGLGLSIVASTAERFGGRVLVDGSTFTLELPLANSHGALSES